MIRHIRLKDHLRGNILLSLSPVREFSLPFFPSTLLLIAVFDLRLLYHGGLNRVKRTQNKPGSISGDEGIREEKFTNQ